MADKATDNNKRSTDYKS